MEGLSGDLYNMLKIGTVQILKEVKKQDVTMKQAIIRLCAETMVYASRVDTRLEDE